MALSPCCGQNVDNFLSLVSFSNNYEFGLTRKKLVLFSFCLSLAVLGVFLFNFLKLFFSNLHFTKFFASLPLITEV